MIAVQPTDKFQCIFGAMLQAIPIPNKVIISGSPLTMTSLAFVGMGVCLAKGFPMPCIPSIMPWMNPSTKFLIGGIPAIKHGMSIGTCAQGGIVMPIPAGKPKLIL